MARWGQAFNSSSSSRTCGRRAGALRGQGTRVDTGARSAAASRAALTPRLIPRRRCADQHLLEVPAVIPRPGSTRKTAYSTTRAAEGDQKGDRPRRAGCQHGYREIRTLTGGAGTVLFFMDDYSMARLQVITVIFSPPVKQLAVGD